jgi:polyhydroxybutyrate depolymerase
MAEEGEAEGFVTVFPEGLGASKRALGWNADFINLSGGDQDDVKFISDVLDKAESELRIDVNREYVCGHSNGAFLANEAGARLSTRLAAIASVGGMAGLMDHEIPTPKAPISVLLINGLLDNVVAYESSSKALLKGYGAAQSAEVWAEKDGCSPDPAGVTSSDGNVLTQTYTRSSGHIEVQLVTINNGGHYWPGGAMPTTGPHQPKSEQKTGVNAAEMIWTFFKNHPRVAVSAGGQG